jgi:hypothetical protein
MKRVVFVDVTEAIHTAIDGLRRAGDIFSV